mmetsp:Transcript_14585/g.59221  ORF Transcript_14585/g.59221 Transcript_14585/m.59221 type:complete len:92 (+) Transcript_14585:2202-2477(+)
MATTRRLTTDDLYKFNLVNLDPFTVTFNMHFYFQYMSQWPDFQKVMLSPNGTIMGYSECFLVDMQLRSCGEYLTHLCAEIQKLTSSFLPVR